MITYLVFTLDVNTNSGVCRAVVSDSYGEGSLTCGKGRDITGTCARVGVTCATVLNVIAACGIIAAGCPEIEGGTLFCRRIGVGVRIRIGIGSRICGSVLAAEVDLGNGYVTCVSGCLGAPAGVDEEVKHVSDVAKATCACMLFAGGNLHFLFHNAGLGCILKLYGNVNGLGAVVLDLNAHLRLAACSSRNACIYVEIGVSLNLVVLNINGVISIVCCDAVNLGITAEVNLNAIDKGGGVTGRGSLGLI